MITSRCYVAEDSTFLWRFKQSWIMDTTLKTETYTKPSSISESITKFLRRSILSGRLKPGQKINEREIADNLGVSRSPIREALRVVAKEGLIKIEPHKGAVVSEISRKELLEIFEVREMIELYAVDLIKSHAITGYEDVKKSLELDLEELNQLDIHEYLSRVTKFHQALVKTCGNRLLYQFYKELCISLERYQLLAATIPQRMEASIGEHRSVLEALAKGKFKVAKDLLKAHLEALKLKIIEESDLSSNE